MKKFYYARWIAYCIVVVSFLLAFFNFIYINANVNKSIEELCVCTDCFSEKQPEYLDNIFIKIQNLKNGVFDANTITFLVSFALALLFTTILALQEKLLKQNTLLNDAIKENFYTKKESTNVYSYSLYLHNFQFH